MCPAACIRFRLCSSHLSQRIDHLSAHLQLWQEDFLFARLSLLQDRGRSFMTQRFVRSRPENDGRTALRILALAGAPSAYLPRTFFRTNWRRCCWCTAVCFYFRQENCHDLQHEKRTGTTKPANAVKCSRRLRIQQVNLLTMLSAQVICMTDAEFANYRQQRAGRTAARCLFGLYTASKPFLATLLQVSEKPHAH